jgi:hypothetical protein
MMYTQVAVHAAGANDCLMAEGVGTLEQVHFQKQGYGQGHCYFFCHLVIVEKFAQFLGSGPHKPSPTKAGPSSENHRDFSYGTIAVTSLENALSWLEAFSAVIT